MLSIDLKNKTVVITGASRGIGKAIAEIFFKANANLILISRNEKKLKELSNKLNAKYFVLDVSKKEEVEKVFNEIKNIDMLVNNAGVYFTESVENMNIEKWEELLNINLTGAMLCTKYSIRKMLEKKYGRVINISSVSGKFGDPFSSAYVASKFGLIGFTQSLSQEVARENITANCICPGWVETEMAENILQDPKYANLTEMPLEKLKKYSLESVPIGRYIKPEEVAYLALYLASDYASAITGQAINICGGICTS